MEIKGKILSISDDYLSGKKLITLESSNLAEISDFQNKVDKSKDYRIKIAQWRDKRTTDANKLLWACLNEIAKSQSPPLDPWEVYLLMLKRYGKFTHIVIRADAFEDLRKQWREVEIVGDIDLNGERGIQVLCFYGSSTYNTQEFSKLIDGVISEMEEMGLSTPLSEDMRRIMEEYEKKHNTGSQ